MLFGSFPADFQQLLCNYWDEDFEYEYDVPDEVLPLSRYYDDLTEELTCWTGEDYFKAGRYAERLEAGEVFPPLIVDTNNHLRDGYHRLYAMRQIGITEWPVIIIPTCFHAAEVV